MAESYNKAAQKGNLDHPDYYINRELSLIQFQWRVFEEAQDPRNPLLERVKFLAIVASNLTEFFMVRVGSLRMQRDAGVVEITPDGMGIPKLLAEIRRESLKLMQECRNFWLSTLQPALAREGIRVLNYSQLARRQKAYVDDYFDEIIYPVLTPLAFDPGRPFPHISNLSLNLAVLIRDPQGEDRFARVKVPPSLPPLLPVGKPTPGRSRSGKQYMVYTFVWISQVIAANIGKLFPGMEVVETHPFHITRNADMIIQELEAIDLLEMMEENVRKRRFGEVVRLLLNRGMPEYIKEILAENLKVESSDTYLVNGPLDLMSINQITKIDRPDLKEKPIVPVIPPELRLVNPDKEETEDFFTIIQKGNILLHHPYDSFTPVVDFLRAAARDPHVLAIKQTLYRVGNNSPVVKALLEACRDYGKQVAVLVELKARFDEESNITWARLLEQEGVHVIYGLPGLKTHSKIALVVRQEGEHIQRYMHLGTGNYNHITAQIYEDLGMFTCDNEIGADVSDLFNYLTGYSSLNTFRKLLVAPVNLRAHFEEMIRREMDLQMRGSKGHLIFKMNSLVDIPMIRLLYEASQAGVQIDLIVRGMCSLKPGIKGVSENIRVRSIVGRFLEHSRIYYFHSGGEEVIWVGSADLMPRNLNQRVEVLFPIEDSQMVRRIRDDILQVYLDDNTSARIMQPDGSYRRIQPGEGEKPLNAQHWFLARSRNAA